MTRAPLRAASLIALLAIALATACKGPRVAHPLTNEVRYTCCNIHYEKTEITDVNYQRGTLIPFGTRVQILEVRRNSVKFQPVGHPPITAVLKYARRTLTIDDYMNRLFVSEDPHTKLRRAPAKTVKNIEQGAIEPGMTREQVLMALGYPPAHRTPSVDSPTWTYWDNRWTTFDVYFDGDKVSRVSH